MKTALMLLLAFQFFGCRKVEVDYRTDENGVAIRLPHYWKAPISDGEKIQEFRPMTIFFREQMGLF